ncbi:MAG: SIS domain-containing protein, partial [Candidatus Nanopelagicales bacterium]
GLPIHLVVLRDSVEHPKVAVAATAAEQLAVESGVEVSRLLAVGEHPLERMASLCAIGDFASVYLGLLNGLNPTPIVPIEVLKARVSTATQQRPNA